jgi:hypothetical protein
MKKKSTHFFDVAEPVEFFTKRLRQTILILFMGLGMCAVFAQQEQVPQGKWVLESVSILEKDTPIPFSADKLSYELPDEINVQQDEITFVFNEERITLQYSVAVRDTFLCFSVCAEWKINEDSKLKLQWEDDETGTIVLIFILS